MGVVDWGGVVVDEDSNVMVVNTSDLPWRAWLTPRDKETDKDPVWPQKGTPYVAHNWPFLGPFGVPCTQPPWGFLEAIDLKTDQVVWRRVLGTARDSGPFHTSLGLPIPIGIPSQGGAIVTRGGLVFIAGTLDRYLRAFDVKTGRELWRARLPAGAHATPMTYMSGSKQYVVVSAGGHWFLGTKQGDYTMAFTLP
jgi:quinoprotein glucose dehydrogenase